MRSFSGAPDAHMRIALERETATRKAAEIELAKVRAELEAARVRISESELGQPTRNP